MPVKSGAVSSYFLYKPYTSGMKDRGQQEQGDGIYIIKSEYTVTFHKNTVKWLSPILLSFLLFCFLIVQLYQVWILLEL